MTHTPLVNALSDINASTDDRSVLEALKAYSEGFGLGYVYISQLLNPSRELPRKWVAVDNWPEALKTLRRETGAMANDPVVRFGLNAHHAFSWQDVRDDCDAKGRAVLDQACEFGLCEGLIFPIRSVNVPPGGVSLGGKTNKATPDDVFSLEIAARYAYFRTAKLAGLGTPPPARKLSPREAEILTLIAEGCSNKAAASIVGIEPDTVKDTLSRCYRKLGASNRGQAITLALQTSQIYPFTK